jgi:dTDP-4-amino-4,6-dideoxygalactose transaminase
VSSRGVIPVADPGRSHRASAAELDAAIARVLGSGRFVLGAEVEAFEREFASWLGARFAIGVGSGTDAIALALRACGIGEGDEVVTVSHTAVATVAAIEMVGAVPVLADVDPRTMTLDARALEAVVGPRTRAVVPVHLYGRPAAMEAIREVARRRDLRIVEDAAQAHGAMVGDRKVGTLGDAAAFSFYPTKNLGAFGDGGAVVTDDAEVAARCRRLRQYGWNAERVSEAPGVNSRLDELQAAVLRVKLARLHAAVERRRAIAARYSEALAGRDLALPSDAPGTRHAYHLYVVRTGDRERLAARLEARGIGTAVHYPIPVHRQPAYAGRLRFDDLAESDRAAREVLTLPLYPELGDEEVEAVIAAFAD